MKILVINGSPKGAHSNSEILTSHFLKGAISAGAKVSMLYTSKLTIQDCTGCYGCWKNTPGVCVIEDDMSHVIKALEEADAVIFATPLYHYGMTAQLKKLIERTLPMVYPYIVKQGEKYGHPVRQDSKKKYGIISNCGFPERINFEAMRMQFKTLYKESLKVEIYCTAGEFLNTPMKPYLEWYLKALEMAGKEFVEEGQLKEATQEILDKDLVDLETFLNFANRSWAVQNEQAPTVEEAMKGIFKKG